MNQQVAHEIIGLQILTLLLETPTDDSVEVSKLTVLLSICVIFIQVEASLAYHASILIFFSRVIFCLNPVHTTDKQSSTEFLLTCFRSRLDF